MADVEVSYENTLIKSLSASGSATLHTAGKYCDDDITIVYTSPGGGTPEYVYGTLSSYTFAEATTGSPTSIYPLIIGSAEWADVAASDRRCIYLYAKDNDTSVSPTNIFTGAAIWSSGGSTPIVLNARLNSSGNISTVAGTGGAVSLKFLAGATVYGVKLKNEHLDTFT